MLIDVKNISKTYRSIDQENSTFFKKTHQEVAALKNLTFSITRGEIVGYIGLNGAGKSTTIKLLSGILVPDSGSCQIDGLIPWQTRKAHVKKIGVMFGQKSQLQWDLPVKDSFILMKQIYEITKENYAEMLDFLWEELQLGELWERPVRLLSYGQRMRCELAITFIHHPAIVLLDEPTIGIDVKIKQHIHRFIKKMNQKFQTTIIITSHDLAMIEYLCERVILIDHGQKYYDGLLTDFLKSYNQKRVKINFTNQAIWLPNGVSITKKDGTMHTLIIEKGNERHNSAILQQIFTSNTFDFLIVEDKKLAEIVSDVLGG